MVDVKERPKEPTTVEEWLGKDNKLGIDIWNRKYRYNNESMTEWFDRVSGGDPEVRRLIVEKKMLFGGRSLSNRGTGKKASMSNCYSEGFVGDSLEDIMKANTDIAMTFKAQGGQGVSLSKLRPKGAPINHGQFESDGIVPFMEMFNRTTESISQGGSRKGALIITLDAWHKEAPTFITIKTQEGKIQKANLSLEIDDEFMEDVKKYYETGEVVKKTITREYDGGSVTYEVTPIELYKLMMKSAYDWGEPGVIFTNRFRNYNIMETDPEYQIETCNPCFGGKEKLLTTDGYKTFEELCDKDVQIFNADGEISNSHVWCSGEKDIVFVKMMNGNIVCTPDHRFMTVEGDECLAKDLKGKRLMPFTKARIPFDTRFVKYGLIQGDGELRKITKSVDNITVNIGVKDTDIFDLFSDEKFVLAKSGREIYLKGFSSDLIDLGFSKNVLPERTFPSTYDNWTYIQKASFLHGCYSANGCVIKKGRISYKTTCKDFAEKLKDTLINDFGIESAYITTNKPTNVQFANGEYTCKESYDINICCYFDITKFVAQIGFYQQYKREQMAIMLKEKAPKVTDVEYGLPGHPVKVYDFTEPKRHWGCVDGVIVHNCGEQPLGAKMSCNLLSINCNEYVCNPFTDKAHFDFDEFTKDVKIAVRGADKILDENLPNHPLPEQREKVANYRNIGLGIMGMADCLIKLGMKYGSKESLDFMDTVMSQMFRAAFIESGELAKEYGPFPKYNSCILDSEIVRKHFTRNDLEVLGITEHGIRNCSLLSIAPTGSLANLLNVSSGAEPNFRFSYKRKTESLSGEGDKYYDVFAGIAQEYINATGSKDFPDYFVSASDLDWHDRVNMQATLQEHIDTAISSTVNLPNECTVEEIEKLYLYAWEKGLKGITIFRDGCKRVGILSTDDKNKEEKKPEVVEKKSGVMNQSELKRGMIIEANDDVIAKKRTLRTGCDRLRVIAMFDPYTGDLLETYFAKGSTGGCEKSLVGISRLVSLAARGGIDIYSIVDQLESAGVCPAYSRRTVLKHDTSKGSSCPVAIGYALMDMYNEVQEELFDDNDEQTDDKPTKPKKVAKPIEDKKTKVVNTDFKKIEVAKRPLGDGEVACPECGSPVDRIGGCISCRVCGWSRCS